MSIIEQFNDFTFLQAKSIFRVADFNAVEKFSPYLHTTKQKTKLQISPQV